MMRNVWKYIVCMVLFLTVWSCRKLYQPVVAATDTNVLIVEGLIDQDTDYTFIKLSQTIKLKEKTSTQPETGAMVTVLRHHYFGDNYE